MKQSETLQAVIFHFPKTPTIEIMPRIELFLKSLKQKLAKARILKFSKHGLEIIS